MKKTILAKLKSDSGASLMAALLFFIMCATVGSIILAAATASSGRLAGLKRNEQAHYAVNSAADLFSEILKDKKVIVKVSTETNAPGASTDVKYLDPKDTTREITPSSVLLAGLVNAVYPKSIITYNSKFPNYTIADLDSFSGNVPVNLTVAGADNAGLNVTAAVSMNPALDLLVEIKSTDGAETVKVRYTAVVDQKETIEEHNMNNTSDKSGDQRQTTYVKTYTIYWTNPVFE